MGFVYTGWAAVVASTVWAIGRGGQCNGEFLATLLGARMGAVAGADVQFWLLPRGNERPEWILLSGACITAGSVVAYGLSASKNAEELPNEQTPRSSVTPSLQASRDGVLLGATGNF